MTYLLFHYQEISLWPLVFLFVRILGAVNICPLFSSSFLSSLLRSSLSLLLAALLYPKYMHQEASASFLLNIILLFSNFCYGTLLGYFISLPIWLIESCGNIIDMQRGEQIGSIVNQLTGTPTSSIGKLLVKAFTTYMVINNGLLFFFDMTFASFKVIKLNQLFPVIDAHHLTQYIHLFESYFYWIAVLSLPVILVLFLIDILLGLISSFLPQLNVTVISMPIKSIGALLILSIYLGYMFHNVFTEFIVEMRSVL